MNLKDVWDRLHPGTRKWLLDNAGCVILPRTLSARISMETGGYTERDQYGQIVLSREDLDFIRAKAEAAGIGAVRKTDYLLFDRTPWRP
jgi:hypothetical protein